MICLIGTALFIAAVLFEGLVLMLLWRWFVVPVFSAPPLTIAYAIGISLIVGMLTAKARKSKQQPDVAEAIAHGLITPLVFLLVGWIVKAFV